MMPVGSGWSKPEFVLSTEDWRPRFSILKVGDVHGVRVVDKADLDGRWPAQQRRFGAQFAVDTRVARGVPHGGQARVLVRVFDQGRDAAGRKHGFGFGLKLPCPTAGTSGSAAPIPANTRLLPFVIVAKAPLCGDAERAEIYEELRRRHIGSGSYERWDVGRWSLIYDTQLSAAYMVNSPRGVVPATGAAKLPANLKFVAPCAPELFCAWFNTNVALKSGAQLWASYGRHSDHYTAIDQANAEREARSPKVNQQKRARNEKMSAMRAAKAAKRAEVGSEEPVRP